jgi:quercetin dioxygenase-like cupin family protein
LIIIINNLAKKQILCQAICVYCDIIILGGFMKIINLKKVKKIKAVMDGAKAVYKQIPISKNDNTPNFSFRVFTIGPGGHTPYHSHPYEHINYIIDGEGYLLDNQGRENKIKKGDFALVMPDEKHQYKNKS